MTQLLFDPLQGRESRMRSLPVASRDKLKLTGSLVLFLSAPEFISTLYLFKRDTLKKWKKKLLFA